MEPPPPLSQLLLANSSQLNRTTVFDSSGSGSGSESSSPYVSSSPYDVTSRFNPSMAIIIVVLLSAFFFMGFFSVYVRRCTTEDDFDANNTTTTNNNSNSTRPSVFRRHDRPPQGLELALVNNLPIVSYSSVKGGKDTSECAVCLSDFEEDESLRLLPKCGHCFHQDCIDTWLFSHTTCPLCRRSLLHDRGSPVNRAATGAGESILIPIIPYIREGGDGGEASAPVPPAAAEVTIDIDDSAAGTIITAHDQGTPESRRAREQRYEENGAFSQCSSPIYGVMETPPGSKRQRSRRQELRRSHSTGHSLVKDARDRVNRIISSPVSERGPDPLRSPLLLAIESNIHRSKSYTMLSDLGRSPQEGETGLDGSGFSFRRFKRDVGEARGAGSPGAEASSSGASSKGATSAKSSPSSSVRRTFKRLAGKERAQMRSEQHKGDFMQLAYVL